MQYSYHTFVILARQELHPTALVLKLQVSYARAYATPVGYVSQHLHVACVHVCGSSQLSRELTSFCLHDVGLRNAHLDRKRATSKTKKRATACAPSAPPFPLFSFRRSPLAQVPND